IVAAENYSVVFKLAFAGAARNRNGLLAAVSSGTGITIVIRITGTATTTRAAANIVVAAIATATATAIVKASGQVQGEKYQQQYFKKFHGFSPYSALVRTNDWLAISAVRTVILSARLRWKESDWLASALAM